MNPHLADSISATEMLRILGRNNHIISQLANREILARYKGSILGGLWMFIVPLGMLAIYTFVFSKIFNARWNSGTEESTEQFAIILFVGLLLHSFLAEIINRLPALITGNVNFVKKVVFPLESLSFIVLEVAVFGLVVNVIVLLMACLYFNTLHFTAVFLPVVLLPILILALGISWMLASLGVFVRDISQATPLLTTAMLFLSPVFFPISALPDSYQQVILLNPLTFIIEESRAVLIWGEMPDWHGLIVYYIISFCVCWAGFAWFQKTKRGFADVL
jgi:lipopolysaccharide transport system permease protein